MQTNKYPGKFIVFEGLDGSGQSTQSKLLKEFLTKKRHQVLLTKEPTIDSQAGKKIRKILDKKKKIPAAELQKLFVRDRKEHLENLILPALKKRKIVISDRYFFSTFAYGTASGLDLGWLIKMNSHFLLPDLTLLLKVSPQVCIDRIEKRGDARTLFEKKEQLKKVWQVYKLFPKKFKNVEMIDGQKTIKEVQNQVKKIVRSKLKLI